MLGAFVTRISFKRAIVAVALGATLWVAPNACAAESIPLFAVDLQLQPDGSVAVIETITYDFGSANRHGLFRELSTKHAQPASTWYKQRRVSYVVSSVTRNGVPEPYVETDGAVVNLRIGDPDRTITGQHTYTIAYTIRGAASVFADGLTELYWNVTGDSWPVTIDRVEITARGADGVALTEQAACYRGSVTNSTNCSVLATETETVFSASNILPGQQVTIAQAFTSNQPIQMLEATNWLPFLLGGIILWIVGVITYIVRWRRAFDPRESIIPHYEPYRDFKPMFSGVLIDGRLDSRDIAAGIVYLAQQGFISITQTNEKLLGLFNISDYEVTLKRPFAEADTRFEQDLLSLLFAGQPAVDRGSGFKLFSQFSAEARAEAAAMSVGKTIRLSAIKKNQAKLRSNAQLLQALRQDAKADLVEQTFFEKRSSYRFLWFIPISSLVAFGLGYVMAGMAAALFWPLFIGLLVVAIATTERRAPKGYEARNHLLGFKDFLSVTETERYKFHNAPAKSPQQFMEYLPYAIAFGVEKAWAEVFKDLDIPAPDWYSTSVAGAHFSATDFASDISAFSSSLASSGSSSSGSGGGGSAGGGGGGGGGGSW